MVESTVSVKENDIDLGKQIQLDEWGNWGHTSRDMNGVYLLYLKFNFLNMFSNLRDDIQIIQKAYGKLL